MDPRSVADEYSIKSAKCLLGQLKKRLKISQVLEMIQRIMETPETGALQASPRFADLEQGHQGATEETLIGKGK